MARFWVSLLVLLPLPARAFIFAPPVVDLEMPAGATRSYTLSLINEEGEPVEMRLYLTDLARGPNGDLVFPPAGETPYSCAHFLVLDVRSVALAPMEKRDIRVQVTLPYHVAGGLYAVVMCEAVSRETPSEGILIAPRWRVGSVVRIRVAGRDRTEFDIADLTHIPPAGDAGDSFTLVVRNKGNVHISDGSGHLAILDAERRVVERMPLSVPHMIFPTSDYTVTVAPGRGLPPGQYTAVARLEYQGRTTLSRERHFAVQEGEREGQRAEGADLRVAIEPAQLALEAPGGAFRAMGIKLRSDEALPLRVRAELADVTQSPGGVVGRTRVGSTDHSLDGTVRVEPAEFILEPGRGSQNVRAAFTVPRQVEGGLYGRLTFRAESLGGSYQISGAKEVDLALVISGTARPSARLDTVAVQCGAQEVWVKARLANTGNVLLRPRVQARISTLELAEVGRATFDEFAVLPGRHALVQAACPCPPPGEYRVTVQVDYGEAVETLFWNSAITVP